MVSTENKFASFDARHLGCRSCERCSVKNKHTSVYFEQISEKICETLQQYDTFYVCSPWISDKKILEIIERKGVSTLITSDKNDKKLDASLKAAFTHVYKCKSDIRFVHSKYIICCKDEVPTTVITGSYNYTEAAKNHDENLIIIIDVSISKQYLKNFQTLLLKCNKVSSDPEEEFYL